MGFFLISFDGSVISVATPVLIDELGIDTAQALWATSAYLLAFAAPTLIAGRLGDRYGPTGCFLVGMVLFTAASAACAVAPTIGWLIAARVAQGLGAALAAPQSMAIIRRVVDESWRGQAMGLWSATSALANLLAPPVGGLLVAWIGWRGVFLVNVPLGILVLVLVVVTVPKLGGKPLSIRASDTVLSALALTGIVLAVQLAEGAPVVAAVAAVVGVGAAIGFVATERRLGRDALLPPGLGIPQFVGAAITVGVLSFLVAAMPFPIMLFAQNAAGLSAAQASLLLLPIGLLGAVLAVPAGRIVDRTGAAKVLPIGLAVLLAGLASMAVGIAIGSFPVIAVGAALYGAGSAAAWAPTSVLSMQRLPEELAGAGAGAYNAGRQLGAVIGVAVTSLGIQVALRAFAANTDEAREFALGQVADDAVGRYAGAMASVLIVVAVVGLLAFAAVVGARRQEASR